MSYYQAIFAGVDATGGPQPILGITPAKAGHRVISVITLAGLPGTIYRTDGFSSLVVTDGEIVQTSPTDWTAGTFLALIERP